MAGSRKLSVTYFYREPRITGQSIEGIFSLVKECLKDKMEIKDFFCTTGQSRWWNVKNAGKHSSDVNHITGDVNFLALGLKGKKNILTIHDFGFYENPVHSRLVKLVYRLFWFYLPLKYVHRVTVVSEFTKSKLLLYFKFPVNRVKVIPNPVKPVFVFSKNPKPGNSRILMMGTGRHKNLGNLIEAVKGTGHHIDIIGWPATDELDKLTEYQISYTLHNQLTDEQVYERYCACDLLFNASFYEGFGMPIIEAQAGAMKEVGEGSAILVDPYQPEEIRRAIESLGDKIVYGEIVVRGRVNAAKYDFRKIADQYYALYEELANEHPLHNK
jgi:glycosyltransferase involved in cell wall biosynthesis